MLPFALAGPLQAQAWVVEQGYTFQTAVTDGQTAAWGRGAHLVSKTLTTAPMFLAVPMADRPATPPPMTSTLAGGTRPAAVIWPVKNRPNWLAASTTALQRHV